MNPWNQVHFVKSYSSMQALEKESTLPEVAFLGRSNSGKSSLINALVGRKKLALTSNKPGKTKLINLYQVSNLFYLVDLPGFGYSKSSIEEHKNMMTLLENYLNKSKNLSLLLILIDSRRDIPDEESMYIELCEKKSLNYIVVRTKSDKLNQKERNLSLKSTEKITKNFLFTSIHNVKEIETLRKIILTKFSN